MILDCSTVASSRACLCEMFNISEDQLNGFLRFRTNPTNILGRMDRVEPLHEVICRSFLDVFGDIQVVPEEVIWFHASRMKKNVHFHKEYLEHGLLPLDSMLMKRVWESLFELVALRITPEEWTEFWVSFEFTERGRKYGSLWRGPSSEVAGPHALLVRDSIYVIQPDSRKNYLSGSTLVRDICDEFALHFDLDLYRLYLKATTPIIVKFIHPAFSPDFLQGVLFHVWMRFHRLFGLLDPRRVSFSGVGQSVPAASILDVERLDGIMPAEWVDDDGWGYDDEWGDEE
ncbi:MAG: hypothetical protein KKB70_06310 [Proteobacteria bacterium]|nr:hypothetical protein [Pseudomonadota bacterium]